MSQTPPGPAADPAQDQFWRDYLSNPDSLQQLGRHFARRLPSEPRCQLCAFPFSGPGGRLVRLIGKKQSSFNPRLCNDCEKVVLKHRSGAEVESSLLFADIRGSTTMAESTTPAGFKATLDRFYTVASEAVFANGGLVDKFVGDELVAIFPPFLGIEHAARALQTARDLLKATGHADPAGPWVPVGAGVHTGRMWFGAIGEGSFVEVTVVGDVVNTTARLAAKAEKGEILVSVEAATAAGLNSDLPRRSLELKGKSETTEVVSVQIGPRA